MAIFAVFSCTTLDSGASFLDADARIVCYDSVHKRYMGGAAVWLVLIPFGVPAFFLWLLRRFKVPQMAALFSDNAWLREAIKLAWAEGMAQPVDAALLTVDSISTLHLEALFAFFLHDTSAEDASEIITGARPPIMPSVVAAAEEKPDEHEAKPAVTTRILRTATAVGHWLSRSLARVAGIKSGVSKRILLVNKAASKLAGGQDEAAARRALLLTSILENLRSSGDAAVPPLIWERPVEDEVASLAVCSPDAVSVHASGLRCSELPELMETAMTELSFLFAAYRMDCWYWCVSSRRSLAACEDGVPLPRALRQAAPSPLCAYAFAAGLQGGCGARAKACSDVHSGADRAWQRGPDRRGAAHLVHHAPVHAGLRALCSSTAQSYRAGGADPPLFPAACCSASQGAPHRLRARRSILSEPKQCTHLRAPAQLNVDGEQDSNFFGGIVIAVSALPVVLPIFMRLYLRFVGGGLEARSLVRDSEW